MKLRKNVGKMKTWRVTETYIENDATDERTGNTKVRQIYEEEPETYDIIELTVEEAHALSAALFQSTGFTKLYYLLRDAGL